MTDDQKFDSETDNIKQTENIGKVLLDLRNYPGEDLYCDGDVEDTLLEIVRDRSEAEYPRIIEESANWPILYHLSPLRENIVSWLPIDSTMKVLEIGAGCGAITGALTRAAGHVDSVDLSLKRSRINAYRHMYCDNLTIHVGNFTDVEKTLDSDYDYILLIGVFEYAQSYVSSKEPYTDFLGMIRSHLAPDGTIAIAIENRLGLKYWAGCAEDHLGTYFTSLEDYPDGGVVRTFTDRALIDTAHRCGFKDVRMYYPYPDYKFPINIYSDAKLPETGELKNNLRNFDRDRYLLFNEKNVYDSLTKEGLFHLFSNSYMMILGKAPETDYVRFSNDRLRDYQISTTIKSREGRRVVIKKALTDEAVSHIREYASAGEALSKRYEGSGLIINRGVLDEDGQSITLGYVSGETLENILDRRIIEGDEEGFADLFKEYLKRISYGEEDGAINDLDLIFSNIIVNEDGWTVIDYEWTTRERMRSRDIAFRALYCYILEDERRNKLNLDSIISLLEIDDRGAAELREDEMRFQKRITGNHKSLGEIREAIGNRVRSLSDLEGDGDQSAVSLNMRPQIYEDTGRGFNEEESFFTGEFPIRVNIGHGRCALRIDPCSEFCLVNVRSVRYNGREIGRGRKGYTCNGIKIGRDVYAFATSDPGFTVSLKGEPDLGDNTLEVDMIVTALDAESAAGIGKK